MYFFASAIIIYQKVNEEHVKINPSITFILDHYPSKDEIEDMFFMDHMKKINIMCVQEWSQEQYEAYNK